MRDEPLTNNPLKISHSSSSKMKEKNECPCEESFISKRSLRKRQSSWRTSYMSTSVGGETTITVPSDQKTSNPESCEEVTSDGHTAITSKQRNIRVKEEVLASGEDVIIVGEEDTSSGVKDLGNVETAIVAKSVKPHKRQLNTVKFNIGRSKEISEDLRQKVVEAHKSGKGYKRIGKDLDLHLSTVRKIVYKWKKFSTVATLPRSGRPPKISAKARRTILKHMTENTRVTAKDLKASLALDNINVHESTIRKTLNKWCSWDFAMEETTALQQE
ncbi:uncharacterized protein [Pyxicephalus adspersus]|uniref:uncharacterized protein isoform X2 n=1 Tax=Pyxicephalus adspersus TaxID=30357 RepID=UPI003B599490